MPVWVVGALTDPGPADDALDAALDKVLAALDKTDGRALDRVRTRRLRETQIRPTT